MPAFIRIHFYDQYCIDLQRIDSMQPMDLGDGPEMHGLVITAPKDSSEVTWNPLFGTRSLYTGYLHDGENAPQPVVIKWARSKERMEKLKREGDFYCSALRGLLGVTVPKFYGYYTTTDSKLNGLGCMILEEMDGAIPSDEIDDRSKLEAAYRLHKAGVRHYGFHRKDTFITHGDKVCIIGFSEAKERCGCKITWDRVRLCPEMMWMEQEFGGGEASSVLKEIGVPLGWRECLFEAVNMAGGKPYETAVQRCTL